MVSRKKLDTEPTWLTLRRQRHWIRKRFPLFDCKIKRGVLVAEGGVQPTKVCEQYRVRIVYQLGYHPKSFVLHPVLECPEGREGIPHLNGDGSLCLYFPAKGEWTPRHKLSHTIIPWISMWLFYYEYWLFTGERGGWGGHPAEIPERYPLIGQLLLSRAAKAASKFGQLEEVRRIA